MDYESRLRILTLAYNRDDIQHQTAWTELKTYLYNTLTTDKFNVIMDYFTFPLSVVNISNDIMQDLYTVFSGRNASFEVHYSNERFKEIASNVLSVLNIKQWIEDKGKDVLKCMPNSVVITDIDTNGNPLLLLVSNDKIKGYEFNDDGSFKYIVFCHSKDKYGVYDNEYYRVYNYEDGIYTLETENTHNLGYCPAKFFYDKPLNNKDSFDRSIPLSNTMGVMSQWQLFDTFIYYADHYGAFPAMEYADNECTVDGCNSGIIEGKAILNDDGDIINHIESKPCPNCANKGLIGPGTAVAIEVNEDSDFQDTRGVLRFVVPDITSLKHLKEEQVSKENFIKVNTVGYNNITNKEAVNEQQIKFLAESKSKAPREIATHLNSLYKWITKTFIKLIYNVDIEVSANFGTEFLVMSEKDILTLIQESKISGVQSSEIAELNRMLIETKYKTNPYKAKKMLISADLEPSPFDTRQEVKDKFDSGMISREDYYIKLNFIDLIGRFERENGDIVFFGSDLSYDVKIKRIKDTLIFYTKQNIGSDENDETEQVQPNGTGATDL